MTADLIGASMGDNDRYDCDVISAQFPAGAAWLASCLLELHVAIWNPWGLKNVDEWHSCGDNVFQLRLVNQGWKTLFPGLFEGRKCRFHSSPVPRFHHAMPGAYPAKPKTIMFVRDPRDCLYSAWRRAVELKQLELSAAGFCQFINSNDDHQSRSRQDCLLNYLDQWRAVERSAPVNTFLVIRFEDSKKNPAPVLQSIVEFLSISASLAEIELACTRSSFDQGKRAEQSVDAAFRAPFTVNRAGIPLEFHQSFDPQMHQAISEKFAPHLDWLGYESLEYRPFKHYIA